MRQTIRQFWFCGCFISCLLLGILSYYTYYHTNSISVNSVQLLPRENPSFQVRKRQSIDPNFDVNQSSSSNHQFEFRISPESQTYLDYSRCPLSKPFQVYLYNTHFPDVFPLKTPSVVSEIETLLKEIYTWTEDPHTACVFMVLVGPHVQGSLSVQEIQGRLYSLPYWGDSGVNHILVDNDANSKALNTINTAAAIVANSVSTFNRRYNVYHMLTVPVVDFLEDSNIVPDLFETARNYLFYFEGERHTRGSIHDVDKSWRNDIIPNLKFKCEDKTITFGAFIDEWSLCGSADYRIRRCADSTFSLVLGTSRDGLSFVTYTRLIEALRCGSVPVIVGISELPFEGVIDWKKAAILLPTLPPLEHLTEILSSLHPLTIAEFRRRGKFFLENYFLTPKHVLHTIVAIIRSKFYHPPPVSPDVHFKTIVVRNETSNIEPSPRFLNNFTIYSPDLWNTPPGPFYMYPSTPYAPPYTPLMYRQPNSTTEQTVTGKNLLKDDFRSKLRGNYPEEGLTVVALTYHRNKQLAEFLSNFKGFPFLHKVVVVWNNEKEPTDEIEWPDIGVPVEVVITNRNSLNNRFLPFSNIETEAVLAVDDDQKIPFPQLEFAFRIWREHRDRLVGWYDRTVEWDENDPRWVYVWDQSCQTSMILTGAAIFHKYYLHLYSYWMPQAARDLVDRRMNGEDFAMNFLIAYISRKPPIKVDSKGELHICPNCDFESISLVNGASGHLDHRRIVMNELVNIWGHSTLLRTQIRAEPIIGSNKCLLIDERRIRHVYPHVRPQPHPQPQPQPHPVPKVLTQTRRPWPAPAKQLTLANGQGNGTSVVQ